MSMTKKDFIQLADYLRGLTIPDEVLTALIRWCRAQNCEFNENRWRNYRRGLCGPSGGKIKKVKL